MPNGGSIFNSIITATGDIITMFAHYYKCLFWILRNGYWEDNGVWVDNDVWND